MPQLKSKTYTFEIIAKYLVRRAIRNGYADKAFYQSLQNFKEKFHAY